LRDTNRLGEELGDVDQISKNLTSLNTVFPVDSRKLP
jgi:hypothetical protein